MAHVSKFEIGLPFVVQEAMLVAQVIAKYTWEKLANPDYTPEPSTSVALAVPRTISVRTEDLDYTTERGTPRKSKAYFHFGGGMAVVVNLTSWLTGYGEHWEVVSVKARFYVSHEGRGREEQKTEKIWSGEELQALASLWGSSPPCQHR